LLNFNPIIFFKKLISLIGYNITIIYKEFGDYPICYIFGSKNIFRFKLFIYKALKMNPVFNTVVNKLWIGRKIRFEALDLTYIDPLKIKYQVRRPGGGPSPFIDGGDWDNKKRKFTWNDAVVQLYIDNLKPEKTDQYKTMKEAIKNKNWHTSRNCRNEKDLSLYFETLNDIYKDMKAGNYLPSTQVNARYQNTRRRYYPDEICVSIGRHGEYIVERGGGHRLSIAQLLEVKSIPIIIIGMHYDYISKIKKWDI